MTYIHLLVHELSIIRLSGGWLNNSNTDLYNLPIYYSDHFIRENKLGRGPLIKKNYPYKQSRLIQKNTHCIWDYNINTLLNPTRLSSEILSFTNILAESAYYNLIDKLTIIVDRCINKRDCML